MVSKIKKFFKRPDKAISGGDLDKKLLLSLQKKKIPTFKQLLHLPKVLNPKEAQAVRIFSAIIFLSLIILIGNLYFSRFTPVPETGGEYTEGLVGAPRYINPIYSSANDVDADMASLIYSGLMKYDSNLQLVPDLAKEYEVSSDALTYTFYLKDNVKWHDGTDFNAEDIVFTIEMIQNPIYKSPLAYSFQNVQAERVEDYVVKFILKEPYAPFLSVLTTGILPEHIWSNINPTNAFLTDLNLQPIGTGIYKFDSFIKDRYGNIQKYTLKTNNQYYSDLPFIDTINFKFYPDFSSATVALNSKEIEGISFLPVYYEQQVKSLKNLALHEFYLPQYSAIFFNESNNSILKDVNVRKALAYAINRDQIAADTLMGKSRVINSPILPEAVGYNPDIEKYNYDLRKASDILEEQGWKFEEVEGEGQKFRKKGDTVLKITLTTVDQEEFVEIAEAIKKDWETMGIKTNLQIVSGNDIIGSFIRPRAYEALLYSIIVGSDPDPYPFWHSSQRQDPGLNLANYYNREADKVIEEARKTLDYQKRAEKYNHFQNILVQDLPAIFLFNPAYTYATSDKIKGIELQRIFKPSDRFTDIEKWYIKTKRVLQ